MTDPKEHVHDADVHAAVASLEFGERAQSSAGAPSLEGLYRAHHDFVWRVVRRLGADDAVVDDLVQDVFLVVRRKLGSYREEGRARAWLVGIARRVVADHRKVRGRATAREKQAGLERSGDDLERIVDQQRGAQAVRIFLDELPEDQRMAFFLIEVEGMTAPEASAALGVKLNTVYSRIRLARKRFDRFVDRWRAARERGR